jgi:RNA polymerase sigma-70 factor (ECF subfamily)
MDSFDLKKFLIENKITRNSKLQLENLIESLSFNDVYNQTSDKMYKQVCLKYAKGDVDLANEYCQLGYIRLNKVLPQFRGEGSLEGWVKKVITSEILNQIRRGKNKSTIQTTNDFDFDRADIEDDEYSEEWMGGNLTTDQLMKAIDKLPETYKKVVFLHYFKNMSHEEIAKKLGTHPGTQRSNLFKAKKILKSYLEKTMNK